MLFVFCKSFILLALRYVFTIKEERSKNFYCVKAAVSHFVFFFVVVVMSR